MPMVIIIVGLLNLMLQETVLIFISIPEAILLLFLTKMELQAIGKKERTNIFFTSITTNKKHFH